MEGFLLVGTNCQKAIKDIDVKNIRMPKQQCMWANCLEQFVNLFVNNNDKNVPPLGKSHQNRHERNQHWNRTSHFALRLLPADLPSPNIVINAYATSNMHILTVLEA